MGQELVARTHHRGVIRKRVMPLNFVQANGEGMLFPNSQCSPFTRVLFFSLACYDLFLRLEPLFLTDMAHNVNFHSSFDVESSQIPVAHNSLPRMTLYN